MADGSVGHAVFNSAAAEPEHGVKRIEQKHLVGLCSALNSCPLPSARQSFMEEL